MTYVIGSISDFRDHFRNALKIGAKVRGSRPFCWYFCWYWRNKLSRRTPLFRMRGLSAWLARTISPRQPNTSTAAPPRNSTDAWSPIKVSDVTGGNLYLQCDLHAGPKLQPSFTGVKLDEQVFAHSLSSVASNRPRHMNVQSEKRCLEKLGMAQEHHL